MNILPDDNCPKCQKHINAATATDGDSGLEPTPGDVTVCVGCAGILQFDGSMKLKELSFEDLSSMDTETQAELLKAVNVVQELNAQAAKRG